MKEKIKNINVIGGGTIDNKRYMIVRIESKENKFVFVKNVSCDELKEKGIIKRTNSYKKTQEWLTTDEGKEWLLTTSHLKKKTKGATQKN